MTADRPAPHASVEQEDRGISICWQNQGFHVYSAGPCFDTVEQARSYRDRLDAAGVSWWPQDKPLPRDKPLPKEPTRA